MPLTTMVKNLLIVNGLIFLAQMTFQSQFPIDELFSQHHFLSKDFKPHQVITALFMHANFNHLLGNMLGLYIFGSKLEIVWGPKRFLTFYLICGIAANLISGLATLMETYPYISDVNLLIEHSTAKNFNAIYEKYGLYRGENFNNYYLQINQNPESVEAHKLIFKAAYEIKDLFTRTTLMGASGAIFGLLAGAAYLFPDDVVYMGMLFPVKMKWLALIYGGAEVYLAYQNNPNDPVAHIAHIGGGAVGFLMLYFSYRRNNNRKLF